MRHELQKRRIWRLFIPCRRATAQPSPGVEAMGPLWESREKERQRRSPTRPHEDVIFLRANACWTVIGHAGPAHGTGRRSPRRVVISTTSPIGYRIRTVIFIDEAFLFRQTRCWTPCRDSYDLTGAAVVLTAWSASPERSRPGPLRPPNHPMVSSRGGILDDARPWEYVCEVKLGG
jgi:hypothetical protein